MRYLHKAESLIPIYGGTFILFLTNSAEMLKEYVPDFADDQVYAHALYRDWDDKDRFMMVLNFDKVIHPGAIAHEALHVAHNIASCRDILPDYENDEPIAYLVEWVTDEVYAIIHQMEFEVTMPSTIFQGISNPSTKFVQISSK